MQQGQSQRREFPLVLASEQQQAVQHSKMAGVAYPLGAAAAAVDVAAVAAEARQDGASLIQPVPAPLQFAHPHRCFLCRWKEPDESLSCIRPVPAQASSTPVLLPALHSDEPHRIQPSTRWHCSASASASLLLRLRLQRLLQRRAERHCASAIHWSLRN